MNTFYHGDCLFVMRHDIAPESVDLIYLDPPFFTGKKQKGIAKWTPGKMPITYEDGKQFWKEKGLASYAPAWLGHLASDLNRPDFAAYLFYMMERLQACHKVLKKTGSIYLHCDWRASHYLKMIIDEIFGYECFRNEIIWCYTGPGSPGMRQFMRKHDIILYYAKGSQWVFRPERFPYKDGAPHSGGFKHSLDVNHYQELGGKIPEDWWADIAIAVRSSKERVGYPTQKPLDLLERIIKASSNEGDVILDPFCGCGTAIIAAQKLNRQWIGVDISKAAYEVSTNRLGELPLSFPNIAYISRDLEEVKSLNPIEFEKWVNEYYKATKPSPDRGVDGIVTTDGTPIQVKTFQIKYDTVDKFLSGSKLHPLVPKPIKKLILVSQVGFDDSARKREFEIKASEDIQVILTTPEQMLSLQEATR